MNGIESNGVALMIGKLPGRKQQAIYFEEGSLLLPFAYIKDKDIPEIERLWRKMFKGIVTN